MSSSLRTLLVVSLVGFVGCTGQKPTEIQAKQALTDYLKAEYSDENIQHLQIIGPNSVRVGDYESAFKAWPVYADYQVRYTKDDVRVTQNGKSDVAASFIKITNGQAVCFKPNVFSEAEEVMKKEMEKMMQQIDFGN